MPGQHAVWSKQLFPWVNGPQGAFPKWCCPTIYCMVTLRMALSRSCHFFYSTFTKRVIWPSVPQGPFVPSRSGFLPAAAAGSLPFSLFWHPDALWKTTCTPSFRSFLFSHSRLTSGSSDTCGLWSLLRHCGLWPQTWINTKNSSGPGGNNIHLLFLFLWVTDEEQETMEKKTIIFLYIHFFIF